MREIKFRAWDKERNMFVPYGEIIFKDYGDTLIQVLPNCIEYIGDKVHNGEPQYSRFDIQQFTGLKDKNGVEIYEGDIVSGFDNGIKIGNPDVIVFENGRFKLDKTPEDLIHWVSNLSYRSLKVIGSIHSNPELIK